MGKKESAFVGSALKGQHVPKNGPTQIIGRRRSPPPLGAGPQRLTRKMLVPQLLDQLSLRLVPDPELAACHRRPSLPLGGRGRRDPGPAAARPRAGEPPRRPAAIGGFKTMPVARAPGEVAAAEPAKPGLRLSGRGRARLTGGNPIPKRIQNVNLSEK